MHGGCAFAGNLPLTNALPICPTAAQRPAVVVADAGARLSFRRSTGARPTQDSAAMQCAERIPMLKYILPAAVASLLACSTASAAPVSVPTTSGIAASQASGLIEVQHRRGRHRGGRHHGRRGHHYRGHRHRGHRGYYHGGRRYGHRYYSRPYGWRSRGCVIVGPLWFCP